jgi:2'-5' RNA ligase
VHAKDKTEEARALVRTIGVVVGIPEPWGSLLDQHRHDTGDPMAPLIPAHLTLLGPAAVDPAPGVLAEIEAHLAVVAAAYEPFTVRLSGPGTFRPVTQVVFVALGAGTAECAALAAAVRSGPLQRPLAYPYHPHVTVAHDLPPDVMDAAFDTLTGFEAEFAVDEFTLYEHGQDGRWRPLRSYRLARPNSEPAGGEGVAASQR